MILYSNNVHCDWLTLNLPTLSLLNHGVVLHGWTINGWTWLLMTLIRFPPSAFLHSAWPNPYPCHAPLRYWRANNTATFTTAGKGGEGRESVCGDTELLGRVFIVRSVSLFGCRQCLHYTSWCWKRKKRNSCYQRENTREYLVLWYL